MASCQRLRVIVFELPSCLCGDVISTCVWLRRREQYLRSKITSVTRVAHVLLLRPISGNMDVNTLVSKRSELIGNAEILLMRRVIHNNSTCVCFQLPRLRRNARTQASTYGQLYDSIQQHCRIDNVTSSYQHITHSTSSTLLLRNNLKRAELGTNFIYKIFSDNPHDEILHLNHWHDHPISSLIYWYDHLSSLIYTTTAPVRRSFAARASCNSSSWFSTILFRSSRNGA